MNYCSPSRRFVAYAIDFVVVMSLIFLLGLICSLFAGTLLLLPMLGLWFFGGLFSFIWLYFALLESSPWQATVGKKILGLKVVHLDGSRISFGRATARYFSKFLSRFPI